MPKHFHQGHPTPWREGVAIQFWNEDGTEWVGNFQAGWGATAVFELTESANLFVIAAGVCYLVPKVDPEGYACEGLGVMSALVDDTGARLILGYQGGDLIGYAPDGRRAWVKKSFAVDGIRLHSCASGIVTAEIEYDYEGSWRPANFRASYGTES